VPEARDCLRRERVGKDGTQTRDPHLGKVFTVMLPTSVFVQKPWSDAIFG
jgi:hypothetical protein